MKLAVHPGQFRFLTSKARKVLMDGGRGAAKSYALALSVAQRASVKGAREGLVRKHLNNLRATTLKTLLEGDGRTPPILPPGSYRHDRATQTIRLRGGGEIVYFGLPNSNPQKAGSYNLSGLAIEEITELTEAEYLMLLGCVRLEVPGLSPQTRGVCNPDVPSHWVARHFGITLNYTPAQGTERIFASPYDNKANLHPDFLTELEAMTGVARARFLDGKWVASERLVYDKWDRRVHMVEKGGPWARVIVGVDDGYNAPFVALRICQASDETVHVEAEVYRRKLVLAEKIQAVRSVAAGAEAVLVDPSAASLIADFCKADLPAMAADNEVIPGIDRVQARLNIRADGLPGLTVSPECVETIREFESYERKVHRATGTVLDEPDKSKSVDHAMDPLRYVVTYLDGGPNMVQGFAGGDPEPRVGDNGGAYEVTLDFDKMRQDPDFGFD